MYHISAPMNKFRFIVMLLSVLGIVLSIIFLNKLFALNMLKPRSIFMLAVLFCAATTIFRWLSRIMDGVAEVLVVFDQKGKAMTFADLHDSYKRGRDQIK